MAKALTKQVEVDYFHLTTPLDMHKALAGALTLGYYGTVTVNQAGEWLISLTGPGNPRIDGHLGETFVWNGASLAVLSTAQFPNSYIPEP